MDPFRYIADPANKDSLPEEVRKAIITQKLVNTPSPHRDQYSRTLLILAVWADNQPAASFLLDQGADINQLDELHDSAFLLAGASGRLEILNNMLANAARVVKFGSENSSRRKTAVPDFTVVNRYGGTALIPACERGHVGVVKALQENTDINPDHLNNMHWTGLHEVITLGGDDNDHVEITKLLIKHGADVNLPEGEGKTPLRLAREKGLKRIAALLEAAGGHE